MKITTKPTTTETSSKEGRKPCFITLTGSVGNLESSGANDHRERKIDNFEKDAKLLSVGFILKSKKTCIDNSPEEVENKKFGKGVTQQKCERRLVKNICRGHVSDVYSRVKCDDRTTIGHSRTSDYKDSEKPKTRSHRPLLAGP